MSCNNCGTCDSCRAAMNDNLTDLLCEAAALCDEAGADAVFVVRGEADVTRDDYQSIQKLDATPTTTYTVCIQGLAYQPDRYRLTRSGLAQEVELLIFTPTKAWIDLEVDFRDIDIRRTTVDIGPEQYRIKEKGRANIVIGTVPLYYTFGLVKE